MCIPKMNIWQVPHFCPDLVCCSGSMNICTNNPEWIMTDSAEGANLYAQREINASWGRLSL